MYSRDLRTKLWLKDIKKTEWKFEASSPCYYTSHERPQKMRYKLLVRKQFKMEGDVCKREEKK